MLYVFNHNKNKPPMSLLISCLSKTTLKHKAMEKKQSKKEQRKIQHVNANQKQVGAAILITKSKR